MTDDVTKPNRSAMSLLAANGGSGIVLAVIMWMGSQTDDKIAAAQAKVEMNVAAIMESKIETMIEPIKIKVDRHGDLLVSTSSLDEGQDRRLDLLESRMDKTEMQRREDIAIKERQRAQWQVDAERSEKALDRLEGFLDKRDVKD